MEEIQRLIDDGDHLEDEEMIEFMPQQSDESRRFQLELNCHFHTPDGVRRPLE